MPTDPLIPAWLAGVPRYVPCAKGSTWLQLYATMERDHGGDWVKLADVIAALPPQLLEHQKDTRVGEVGIDPSDLPQPPTK